MFRHKGKDDRAKPTMPVVMRISLSVILIMLAAVIFTWFLQYRMLMNDAEATWEFVIERKYVFAYSCALMFLLISLVAVILWGTFFGIGLSFVIISIVGYINMQKYAWRAAPLVPEDFKMAGQAGEMMQFVDTGEVVRLILGSVLILLGAGLLEHYVRKAIGKPKTGAKWWERWAILPRLSFGLMIVVTLMLSVNFTPNRETTYVEWLDTWFSGWNQNENYKWNGFVIGFLYNLRTAKLEEPEGYDKDKITEIAQAYQELKKMDTERKSLDQIVDNVIFVMNESFYDPELYEDYVHGGGDVIPNVHEIFKKYPSGYMYSPEYGGNTANVEYAAFTGLSNFWANEIPYVSLSSQVNRLPGLVSFAKNQGFSTKAIHAYDGTMYKRNYIYNYMLFDDFIDRDKMKHTSIENGKGYISDSETYQEILDVLGDGEKKHLVAAVTMQNHMPHDVARYPDLHFPLNQGVATTYLVESSFESLNYSDKYLGEFIEKLNQLDERTVMIWFGDHAAGVLYEYIDSEDKARVDLAHLTPYFIYANFDLENDLSEKEVAKLNAELGFKFNTKGVDLPVVTPNCLSNILYNLLGAEKPTLMYLLDTVCEETPILAQSYYGNTRPAESKALKAYEYLSYDILGGKRYWLEYSEEE